MSYSVLAVALGSAFIYVFFRTVQSQWPESYFVVRPGLLVAATKTPWRFLAFRFGPIFVTVVFITVSLQRAGESALPAVLALAMVHVGLTSARGILRQLRGGLDNLALLLFYIGVALGVFAAAIAAYFAASGLESLVPEVGELSGSLWTALLAGIVGAFLIRVSRRDVSDPDAPYKASKRSLGSLWTIADAEARTYGADPVLVQAIMLVENLERPPWARRLEHAKGRLWKRGSYGVMQVRVDHPISDEESIRIVVRDHLAGVVVTTPNGFPVQDAVEAAARAHNPDQSFIEAVVDAYRFAEAQRRRWAYRLEACPVCASADSVVDRTEHLDARGNTIASHITRIECRNPSCPQFVAPEFPSG